MRHSVFPFAIRLEARDLPMPLSVLQGIVASEIEGLDRLYVRIDDGRLCQTQSSLNTLAEVVRNFEDISLKGCETIGASLRETLALERMKQALGEGDYVWRRRQAFCQGGVSEAEATEILRTDPASCLVVVQNRVE
jgi:hypothetical protein